MFKYEKKKLIFFFRGISKFCKAIVKPQLCYLSGMSVHQCKNASPLSIYSFRQEVCNCSTLCAILVFKMYGPKTHIFHYLLPSIVTDQDIQLIQRCFWSKYFYLCPLLAKLIQSKTWSIWKYKKKKNYVVM